MEKVKLPKEVAKSIEDLREIGADNWDIVFTFASGDEYHNHLVEFAKEHTDRFLQALVNGYEIEMTPEEKVYEYYHEHTENSDEKVGVCRTLNLLGIKIEGVNTRCVRQQA
ncbi:DUF1642 domain-containing protein [Aneurinibacillus migulanus]|uniref:DUF1642 domain-containing protein n=1 Tax=Aneurinibacillus migulanus TaxID=47500 RepID=UPI00209C8867|nr:DUF1642 domain-containing protein [Aneurinibacillus migulanus]MCP1355430.1 DUF1642 domain-containing protein [Aneurinibacillus migulanus]